MHPPFTADQLHHLPGVLSAPRFARYLVAKNHNRRDALELYHWNLQVSSAFMVPLHVAEVSLRNGIVEAIEAVHGGAWPWTDGFIISIPGATGPNYNPKRDLQNCASAHNPRTGKVIADLKFAFWEKMLTKRHQGRIWSKHFFNCFPSAPRGVSAGQRRGELRDDVEEIRKIRNRIAHHEPIFHRNLQDDLDRMMRCIEWRSATARAWVEEIEMVSNWLPLKP